MCDDISLTDGKLSAVGVGLKKFQGLPTQGQVTSLDVSENEITDMKGLDAFKDLKTLIVDNNEIGSFEGFPQMSKLETLWANKNVFGDLEAVLDGLDGKVPNLHYLSLLGNPVCKNELMGSTKEEASRYRIYVVHRIPSLKFLDATEISEEERKQANERGTFLKVTKAKDTGETAQSETFYKDAPHREGQHATFLGYQKHYYSGKSSEGNRFIKDDQL